MLSAAEKCKRAFKLMGEEDNHLGPPKYDDCKKFHIFVKFMKKKLYNVTLNLCGSIYVTFNVHFQ